LKLVIWRKLSMPALIVVIFAQIAGLLEVTSTNITGCKYIWCVVENCTFFSISGNQEQFLELDCLIKGLYYKIDAGFQCAKCDHTSKQRQNMANHVEAKHVQHEGVVCPLCHKHFATRQAHRMHHSRVHSYT